MSRIKVLRMVLETIENITVNAAVYRKSISIGQIPVSF